jgi:O-antigen ligase
VISPLNKALNGICNLYLASSCGLFAVLLVSNESVTSAVGSNFSFMLSWVVLYGLSVVAFLTFRFKVTKRDLWILSIPLFHLISVFWSENPQKTLIYSSSFILNAFFVITISRFLTPEKALKNIKNTIILMIILGVFLYFLGYENVKYLDIHARENTIGSTPLRGLFNHKITAGLYAVVALMISLCILKGVKKIIATSICVVFILMTGSATAVVLGFVGFLCIKGIKIAVKRKIPPNVFLFTVVFTLVASISVFSLISEPVLLALNRDPTLTGRTVLWDWGLRVAMEKPFFGWGYGGYLGTTIAEMAAGRYVEFRNYDVPHFHNSLIQILVDGGILYTSFLFATIFYSLRAWYKSYLMFHDVHSLAFVSIVLLLVIGSFFIYYFSRYNDFATIFMMLAVALMPRQHKQIKV